MRERKIEANRFFKGQHISLIMNNLDVWNFYIIDVNQFQANFLHLATCALLSVLLCSEIVNGLPLNPEDVALLLPETPKTKNETVAAIVQDAVVQEAVQSVVGANGTLSGLVVKKNTVILPANQPDVVRNDRITILID